MTECQSLVSIYLKLCIAIFPWHMRLFMKDSRQSIYLKLPSTKLALSVKDYHMSFKRWCSLTLFIWIVKTWDSPILSSYNISSKEMRFLHLLTSPLESKSIYTSCAELMKDPEAHLLSTPVLSSLLPFICY